MSCHEILLTCFMASARTIMTSTGPKSTHFPPHVFSAPLKCFVVHSDKRYPVSKSFFTHPSKCYSSFFSITWPFLSVPAQSHLTSVPHSSRIRVPTSRILERFGISFGAVLPPFSHVRGWQFIRICRVLRRGRRRIAFNDGYGTRFSPLPNIVFHCSSVPCWCLSTYWLGRSDNTLQLGK